MVMMVTVVSPPIWPWIIGPHRIKIQFIQVCGIGHAFQIFFRYDTDFLYYRAFLVSDRIVCHDVGFAC